MAGRLPLEAEAEVHPLQREITREPVHVDSGFLVRQGEATWIEHIEGFAQYKRDDADRIAHYAMELAVAYRVPVFSTAVLMFERHDRTDAPEVGRVAYGSLRLEYPVRLLRLWQIPGQRLVELRRPNLIPWVPLLESPPEVCSAATRILDGRQYPDETGMFLFLGELRYGEEVWRQVLERGFRMVPEELLEQTSYYRKWTHRAKTLGLEEGLEKGLERGLEKGRLEGGLEARRNIAKLILAQRFPALSAEAYRLDAAADDASLDQFILHLSLAPDAEAGRQLLEELVG